MKVRFVRQRTIYGVNSTGPFERVFEVGDVETLTENHARTLIMSGDAVIYRAPEKVEVVETDQAPRPAKKTTARKRAK